MIRMMPTVLFKLYLKVVSAVLTLKKRVGYKAPIWPFNVSVWKNLVKIFISPQYKAVCHMVTMVPSSGHIRLR